MKKSFYILAAILLLAILAFLLFWLRKDNAISDTEIFPAELVSSELIVPDFMTESERIDFGLSADSQVQVINRSASGVIMTYKIIRSDDDLVTNRSQLHIRE
jgi:hypothetical protein